MDSHVGEKNALNAGLWVPALRLYLCDSTLLSRLRPRDVAVLTGKHSVQAMQRGNACSG